MEEDQETIQTGNKTVLRNFNRIYIARFFIMFGSFLKETRSPQAGNLHQDSIDDSYIEFAYSISSIGIFKP